MKEEAIRDAVHILTRAVRGRAEDDLGKMSDSERKVIGMIVEAGESLAANFLLNQQRIADALERLADEHGMPRK